MSTGCLTYLTRMTVCFNEGMDLTTTLTVCHPPKQHMGDPPGSQPRTPGTCATSGHYRKSVELQQSTASTHHHMDRGRSNTRAQLSLARLGRTVHPLMLVFPRRKCGVLGPRRTTLVHQRTTGSRTLRKDKGRSRKHVLSRRPQLDMGCLPR